MKKTDPAVRISNPRILSAVYFGLLSVVGTILTNAFLTTIGIEEVVPVFKSVLLGMIVASATGAVFGERIVHCEEPYKLKTFLTGFMMVLASLPLFVLGLVLLMDPENNPLFSFIKFHDTVYLYLVVLAYSYMLFGFGLAVAAGLAAMYLRGQLVYDILHIYTNSGQPKKAVAKTHPPKSTSSRH